MDSSRTDVFALKDVADRGAKIVRFCVDDSGPNRYGGWLGVGNARGFFVMIFGSSP